MGNNCPPNSGIHLDSRGALGSRPLTLLFITKTIHISGDHMNFTQMQHIPLASAYLCPDCNCIGNCASQCPACASPVLMALANVLDRKPEREAVAYPSIIYRSARRRAFLVPGGPRAVHSLPPAPTPITIKAGALSRAHAPWRVAHHDVDTESIGFGGGAAS